jgi:hypothetical protein
VKLGRIIAAGAVVVGVVLWMIPTRTAALRLQPVNGPAEAEVGSDTVPGSKLLSEYAKIDFDDEPARHRFVLDQVAKGNMPDSWDNWVTITVWGQKGTVVEFDVSPHGLRLGTTSDWVEVPMDGPHFAAAAEILGHKLATAWMVEKTYLQAEKDGGATHYYAAAEIALTMGDKDWKRNAPNGRKMKGPAFFRQRSALLRDWLNERGLGGDALVSGYFKAVVPPIDGLTRRRGLEMVGGYDDVGEKVQSISGGFHHLTFFDYSHNIRLARNEVRVDGRKLTLNQFFMNERYAWEFGFRRTGVPDRAYPYPKELAQWMEQNGHLKYPLGREASKTNPKLRSKGKARRMVARSRSKPAPAAKRAAASSRRSLEPPWRRALAQKAAER